MAFKKGISGNPGGSRKEKIFTDALRLEANRTGADGRKRINKLAEKLVKCALTEGESWAFNMIADRLEGKPMQPVEHSGTDDRDVKELTDAELTALIRRSQLATDEERPEGESLN